MGKDLLRTLSNKRLSSRDRLKSFSRNRNIIKANKLRSEAEVADYNTLASELVNKQEERFMKTGNKQKLAEAGKLLKSSRLSELLKTAEKEEAEAKRKSERRASIRRSASRLSERLERGRGADKKRYSSSRSRRSSEMSSEMDLRKLRRESALRSKARRASEAKRASELRRSSRSQEDIELFEFES